MITERKLLESIGRTEASSFNELCRALGSDCPGDSREWAALFRDIEDAEKAGLIEVERLGDKISQLQLTDAGADLVRDRKASYERLRNSPFGQSLMNRDPQVEDD